MHGISWKTISIAAIIAVLVFCIVGFFITRPSNS